MDPLTAAGIALGFSGLLGNIFGNSANYSLQRETALANLGYQYWNTDQQRKMFNQSLSQQWKMQEAQNAFNEEQTWKMFNAQNEYNSPQNQLNRVIAAGLNPMTVAGATPVAASTTPSFSGSGGSPVGVPHITAPQMAMLEHPAKSVFDSVSATASQIKDLSIALNNTAQSKRSNRLLEADLERTIQETANLKEDERAKQIANTIQSALGEKKMNSEIALNIAKFGEALAHRQTLIDEGDWYNADAYLKDVQSAYYDVRTRLSGKELKWYDEVVKWQLRRQQQDIRESQSRSSMYYSEVKLNASQQKYLDSVTEINYYVKGLKENELLISDTTIQHQIQSAISQCIANFYGSEVERNKALWLFEQWKIAEKDNNTFYMRMILNQLHETIGDGLDIAGAIATRGGSIFAPARSGRSRKTKKMNSQGYPVEYSDFESGATW